MLSCFDHFARSLVWPPHWFRHIISHFKSILTRALWCLLVCHPHLTIILCCQAVWAQACVSECKTSFVIFTHLWFTRLPQLFLPRCRFVGGAVLRYCHFWYILFRSSHLVITPVLGVLVNPLQYHDTANLVHDSETKDPQLVAERRVGRNHGKTMGKS